MHPSKKNLSSRREFLGQLGCASLGTTALYSTLINLAMTSRASAQAIPPANDEYRALVCIFLGGGNDSYNMLVPSEASEYASYQAARGELSIAAPDLLPITNQIDGKAYGLNPALPQIQGLYNSGDLGFLANVGTLVEPTSKDDFLNDRARLPLGLFSHSDQQMHWQSSIPDQRSAVGWVGRTSEILQSLNESSDVSMNISLGGMNIMQSGNSIVPYTIGPNGVNPLSGYNDDWRPFVRVAVDSLLDQHYDSMLKRAFSQMTRRAIDAESVFTAAVDSVPDFTTPFTEDRLSREMRMIARSIGAQNQLGMRRQTFFINFGGWDHHDNLLEDHGEMLAALDEALKSFWDAMGEIGMRDKVTVFSASDFGRTLTSNGDGSDHAWGGHQFILGGQVKGGCIHGSYPEDIGIGGPQDVERGRLIPTTSVDEYFGDLVRWMGVSNTDLPTVLPNLERFYSIGSENDPIGLFS